MQPLGDLRDLLDRADVGFLEQLAQRSRIGIFALVDTALRHLPIVVFVDVFSAVDTAADESFAGLVEHHDADARPIGQIFKTHRHANPLTPPDC